MINDKGQSLVEVMVAVAILGLVMTTLVFGTTVAMRNANFARYQARATKYAQEGLEWLRNQRDQDWGTFASKRGNTYCLNSLAWTVGPCSSFSLGGVFKREAVLSGDENKIQVELTVFWQDPLGTHQTRLTSYFTKWQ